MKKEKKVIVDGKAEEEGKKDLYDILGESKRSPFKKQSSNQYKKELSEMNASDLYKHAIEVGLIPIDNRRILLSRLEKEFARSQVKMTSSQSKPAIEDEERAKRFMDILHGRKQSTTPTLKG